MLARLDRTAESFEYVARSIEVLEQLVEEDGDTPERLMLLSGALVNLGIHHQWSERYEEALDCFSRAGTYQARALELSPENAQLRFVRAVTVANEGTVLTWLDEPARAVECFARAAEASGEDPRFLRYLAGEYLRAAAATGSAADAADYDDAGYALLERAIAAGYRDLADLAESPQLDRLRSRREFVELTTSQ